MAMTCGYISGMEGLEIAFSLDGFRPLLPPSLLPEPDSPPLPPALLDFVEPASPDVGLELGDGSGAFFRSRDSSVLLSGTGLMSLSSLPAFLTGIGSGVSSGARSFRRAGDVVRGQV